VEGLNGILMAFELEKLQTKVLLASQAFDVNVTVESKFIIGLSIDITGVIAGGPVVPTVKLLI
jgi:hypothetical protein